MNLQNKGQGRLDGAFCTYTETDKAQFLRKLYDNGVRNIEMESTVFSAFTHHANVRAAIVNVTLLDRLQGDQVRNSHYLFYILFTELILFVCALNILLSLSASIFKSQSVFSRTIVICYYFYDLFS